MNSLRPRQCKINLLSKLHHLVKKKSASIISGKETLFYVANLVGKLLFSANGSWSEIHNLTGTVSLLKRTWPNTKE